jgi:hypothetical protein
MKRLAATLGLCLTAILCAPALLWAGSTDYHVSIALGSASVSGFIQTDGAIGALSAADITNWNLLLNNGSSSFDLVGPGSGGTNSQLLLTGASFTATSSDLLFNFSNSSGDIVLFPNPNIGSSETWLCFEGTSNTCSGNPSSINWRVGFSSVDVLSETGVQVVATASAPESSLGLLLGINLLGAVLVGLSFKLLGPDHSARHATTTV